MCSFCSSDLLTPPESSDAVQRSGRNVFVNVVANGVRFILQLLTTVVLARLLLPEDFGLIAIALVITGFISIFKDVGLGQAIIHADILTEKQLSSSLWVCCLLGLILTLLVAALAPFVALFFKDDRLFAVTACLGLANLFSASAVVHQALLQRKLRFLSIARAELLAHGFAVAVAILLALYGAGVWSIVALYLLLPAVSTALFWNQTRWVPSRQFSLPEIGGMLRFGANLTGFNFVNFFARNADNFLIGKCLGPVALGHYSRAYQLMLTPIAQINAPITSVLVSTLSRLRDNQAHYTELYLRWVRRIAWITMLPIALMVWYGDKVVLFVLGENWALAGELFRWLALAALFQPLSNITGVVFISTGQSRRMFRWGVFSSLITVLAFAIGVRFGATGVAIAFAIVMNALFPILIIYAHAKTPIDLRLYLRAIGIPSFIALLVVFMSFRLR